jgi:predicted acetyltransferase
VIDLRAFAPDQLPAAHAALELAFGSDPDTAVRDLDLALFDASQTLGAFDGPEIVGTAAYYDLPMSLPGGAAQVAGVTWVGVAPTHHRRGIVTALMTRQLADLHGRGFAVAALWASEPAIYGRFGYGAASWHLSAEVPRGAAFTRPVAVGDVRLVVAPAAALLAPVYDRVVAARPGWWARSPQWWTSRLYDAESSRGGATSLRAVLVGAEGYALYRTKNQWGPGGPDGTVTVIEVVATTPAVEARLWRFLLDQDLMARVKAWSLPVDAPLLHLLSDVRRIDATLRDALWVRLVSVPEALVLRDYAAPVDVVLEVSDAVCPWNAGRWRFTGDTCTATAGAPDLSLDVRDLGAAFLGGTTLAARAAAGWVVEHTPGALASASTAFSWPGRAPHCPMVF